MDTYKRKNGEILELPEIEVPKDIKLCFKISLPSSEEDFEKAEGEGIWACTTEEGMKAWDEDLEGEYFVRLLNNSTYYPTLSLDTVIPVEFRKRLRPVAYYEDLVHQYGPCRRGEVVQFMENKLK